LVSVGVRWTSVGLSAAVQSFLVEFDCWFGESPTDSPLESPSDSPVQQTCTGKSPESHRTIPAIPEPKFWHSG